MIIWKGRGILAFVIPVVCGMILQLIFGEDLGYMAGIGYVLGGGLVYYFGAKWNANSQKFNTEEQLLEDFKKKKVHSLFWIDMQLWSIFWILGGLAVVHADFVGLEKEVLIEALLIGIVLMVIANNYLGYLKKKSEGVVNSQANPTSINVNKSSKVHSATMKKRPKLFNRKIVDKPVEKKNDVFQELKASRNKNEDFNDSDRSKYMPK